LIRCFSKIDVKRIYHNAANLVKANQQVSRIERPG